VPSTTHQLSQYTAASSAQCVPPVLMGAAQLNPPTGVRVGFCIASSVPPLTLSHSTTTVPLNRFGLLLVADP
jgi:hypothetical protein